MKAGLVIVAAFLAISLLIPSFWGWGFADRSYYWSDYSYDYYYGGFNDNYYNPSYTLSRSFSSSSWITPGYNRWSWGGFRFWW